MVDEIIIIFSVEWMKISWGTSDTGGTSGSGETGGTSGFWRASHTHTVSDSQYFAEKQAQRLPTRTAIIEGDKLYSSK